MSSVQDVYRAMLRDRVAPGLRALGFKGSGARYRLDDEECLAQLGFQSSAYNTSASLSFTLNLSVVSRLVWESARREQPYLPTSPSPNVFYGTYVWQRRIGQLMPTQSDLWWDLEHDADPAAVADAVVTAVHDYGLPAMREQLR
ncbi:DUF4304 domain-containing protein [Phytohabitans sp. LJ34]|uniref:DUF4304 domain-containing protein n=1 Tax=Phytohabitans sp. LJ34 TaxID=3452217 RepID=UPI003F8BE874